MKKLRKMKKKGAIEMSINTIVILLLALAMLGVGMFVINKLKLSLEGIPTVDDVTEKQIRRELEASGDKFSLYSPRVEVKRNSKVVNYYGLKNEMNRELDFYISVGCINSMDGNTEDLTKFDFANYEEVNLEEGEIAVQSLVIKPFQGITLTQYQCEINITYDEESGETQQYASEDFYVDVTA
jgi:hypothetical protein